MSGFGIRQNERVCMFIDGPNFYAASKNLGFDVDFKKMRAHFAEQSNLIRAYYYTAIIEGEEYTPIKPLIDWLDYNGYALVTKPTKEFTDSMGRRKVKGNMDIDLAVDMLEATAFMDHAVLFSGDGDFRRLIEAVQRRGTKVTVVSSIKTQPSMVADELRRQADNFVDLLDVKDIVFRREREDMDQGPVTPRPVRPAVQVERITPRYART